MTSAGLGLNKFCYAGLIAAHMNKKPVADDFDTKVKIISAVLYVLVNMGFVIYQYNATFL